MDSVAVPRSSAPAISTSLPAATQSKEDRPIMSQAHGCRALASPAHNLLAEAKPRFLTRHSCFSTMQSVEHGKRVHYTLSYQG